MAKLNNVDMKIRVAFLLPALAIIVAIAITAAIIPDVIPPWVIPLVALTATISLVLIERKRRSRKSG